MAAWIAASIVFVPCWAVAFYFALLVDEDVNHWNWKTDSGPGAMATVRMALVAGLVALVPATLVWLFVHHI